MTRPALSPILAPDVVCVECGSVLRRVIVKRNNKKLDKINYFCDSEKCKYGITLSAGHANVVDIPYSAPEVKNEPAALPGRSG